MPRRKPTVAIVEDDKELARIWQRKLTRVGYEVVGVFATARAAWKALHKHPPDAILLDWELIPGPNGDWLLKQFTKAQFPTRIDGLSNSWQTVFDAMNRPVATIDPLGRTNA